MGWPVREGPGGLDGWRALGRLLPRDVRERVFEPALADAMRSWLGSGRRVPFALRAVATYLGCFPHALAVLFVRRGRLTRLGRVSLWTADAVAAVLVLVLRFSGPYPSGG